MGKELLSKKELAVDDLGSLQPVQIVKIRKFTVQKVRSEENAKGVVGEPTVEEIVCVSWVHSTISVECRNRRGDTQERSVLLLSDGVNYTGDQQVLENVTSAETLPAWIERQRQMK